MTFEQLKKKYEGKFVISVKKKNHTGGNAGIGLVYFLSKFRHTLIGHVIITAYDTDFRIIEYRDTLDNVIFELSNFEVII